MLYLENITTAQPLSVPRARVDVSAAGALTLTLHSTVDLRDPVAAVTTTTVTGLYVTLGVTLPEGMPDGSYEYLLANAAGKEISRGIVIVGDFEPEDLKEFDKEISYEQFEN